jgi:KUP system potassium uptake protein
VISGAFSVTRQAVQLGFLPRLVIRHTSEREIGQVYVPAVNWGIFAAVVALVVGFGSSRNLAAAYGIAVTGTLAIDTVLFFVVVRMLWHKPRWLVAVGAAAFLTVDLGFFAANVPKVPHGGWFPLGIALGVFTVLSTWQKGRALVTRRRVEEEGPLREFVRGLRARQPPVHRCPGTAVYLNANPRTTPLALRANVEYNHALHEHVLVLSIETTRAPHVLEDDRLVADELGIADDGIVHLTARFGFQDHVDVPEILRLATRRQLEGALDLQHATYFLSRITIVRSGGPGMRSWRKRLFMAMARNAADPVAYFRLPDDRTVTMGAHVVL